MAHKRALSRPVAITLLSAVAVAALTFFVVPKVASANTDLFGFDLSTPQSFDTNDGKNPHGQGNFTLDTKSEPLVWYQGDGELHANVYNYDGQIGSSALMSSSNHIHTVASGNNSYKFVSTVGYDPNGTGHNDSVATVGLDDSDDDEQKLVVMRHNGTGGQVKSRSLNFMRDDDDDDSDWQDDIEQWAYNAYFVITAGDYDGNGMDELAVYFFQRGNPRILILNGQTLDTIRELPLVNLIGSTGAYLSDEFHKDAWTARATPQLSMDTSDVNRDGSDDLLVVASYADIYDDSDGEELTARGSVVGFYPSAASLAQKWTLDKNATGGHYMRTASIAAGDIDNDGFDEAVVAGFFMDSDGPDADDELDGKRFLITTFNYTPGDQGSGMSLGVSKTVDMNEFTRTGYYSADTMVGTPALTCFKARGRNAAEDIFLAGTVYRWNKNSWEATNTASHCTESDRGIDGWLITNTWVDHCVAANFDSNNLGAEQVMFSSGYKQDSVSRYFYRVALMGYGTKTEGDKLLSGDFYECNNTEVVRRSTKGNRPSCTFAALDVDNDSDTLRFKKKRYEYSNVNIMAILQPPPFFDDLKKEYFAAVGTTCYGKKTGTEQSTKVTYGAKAGCYVNGGIDLPILKFTAEGTYTHDWLWEYENSLSQELTWTLENHSFDNAVVLYRTPVTLYDYEVTPAKGGAKSTLTVGIPEEPTYLIIDASRYNELVAQDPSLKGKEVTSAVAGCVGGIPDSYPQSPFGLKNFTGAPNKITVSNRNSTQDFATQVITTGSSSSQSQSYTNSFELKIGVDSVFGLNLGGGGIGGGSWGDGSTTVDYSSIEKTGQVAFPPATDTEFAFNFRFGTWATKLGDTEVPVLGYVVDGVTCPPSRPKDLAVETVSTNSMTIGWNPGVKSPQQYEIYQYFDDDISGVPYSHIATVSGSDSSYTYEGLLPSTTYQLAIRSVNYEDGERKVSPYTSVVTGTTLGTEEAPIVTGITSEQNVCTNDTATFVVTARPSKNATSGLTYAWQVRQPGTTNWRSCGVPSNSTLVLANVTEDMDGSRYRCVVSEAIGGIRRYAYSGVGVLNVGMADSSLVASATNVDERTNNPYQGTNRGLAGTVKLEDDPQNATTVSTDKQVAVTIGNEAAPREFVQYRNAHESASPEYIYLHDGTYYALEGLNQTAGTAETMVPLALVPDRFSVADKDSAWNAIAPQDLVRTGPRATYTSDGHTYLQYQLENKTLFALVDDGVTTWYELGKNAELREYTEDTSAAEPVYTQADEVVYVLDGKIANSDIAGAVPYDKFWPLGHEEEGLVAYCAADGTGSWYVADDEGNLQELMVEQSDGMYRGQGSQDYAVRVGDAVQVDTVVVPQKSVAYAGDKVRLHAQANTTSNSAPLHGTTSFVINNTTTGSVSTLTTTTDEDGEAMLDWYPEEPGAYKITVGFGGNVSLHRSTTTITYYALDYDEPSDNVFVLDANDAIYGDTIELTPYRMVAQGDGSFTKEQLPVGTSVNYEVVYTNLDGEQVTEDLGANHSYTPELSGSYTFMATIAGKEGGTARCVVYVKKRPIVITAPSKSGLSSATDQTKVPSLDDVVVSYRNDPQKDAIVDIDKNKYPLYLLVELTTSPELMPDSGEGVYTTALRYRTIETDTGAVQYPPEAIEFLQKYDVTFIFGQYVVAAGSYTVNFDAGSNGSIAAYQNDNMSAITSGDVVNEGTRISFVATPDERFGVGSWSVVDGAGQEVAYDINAAGDQITLSSIASSVTVHVTFEPTSFQLSFAAGEHGSIDGAYMVNGQASTHITSPENVAKGKDIVLTATPNEGCVVERWTIARGTGAAQEYTDEYGTYTGNTLRIDNLDANTSVRVYFAEEVYHYVDAFVVDGEGNSAPGCKVLVDGVDEDHMGRHGSRITFTADLPDQMVVKEWRLYLTDEDYEVLCPSAPTYVVGSLQYDMRVGVEVAPFKQFMIHYGAQDEDGAQIADAVYASSAGVWINDGSVCAAYVPVDFVADVPDGYQIESWSVKKGTGEEEVVASGKDEQGFTLPSLLEETWVTLKLTHKPTLTYAVDGGNGTLTCTEEGRASGDDFFAYRMEDFTFVATPDEGFEVDELVVEPQDAYAEVVQSAEANSDAKTYILKAPQDGFTKSLAVTATFKELPHINIEHSLANDGTGTHATIAAQGSRSEDERYARSANANSVGGSLETVYRDSMVVVAVDPQQDYGIRSWLVGGVEVLGAQGLSYAHLGESDNTLQISVNDELIALLGDDPTLSVVAEVGLCGGAVTFGAKGNEGGAVLASDALGHDVAYGTIFSVPQTLTFTATPNAGYDFVGWEVNGATVPEQGTQLSLDVDGKKAYDVRALFAGLRPVATHTLTFAAVEDGDGAHGSVLAKVSKLPDDPQKGYYNTSTYSVGDALATGCAVDQTTGVQFVARPQAGYAVAGWYADAACTTELPGGASELVSYEVASVEADVVAYVKFEPVSTYVVEVVRNGAGEGGFAVRVDGRELGAQDMVATEQGATFNVRRHGTVEVVARPANSLNKVSAWNGVASEEGSYVLQDVVSNRVITLTLSPVQVEEVLFKSNADCASASVSVLSVGEEPGTELDAIDKTVRVAAGKSLRFDATPAEGKMVDSWKVTYANGSVTEGPSLGIDNHLVLEDLMMSATVEVRMRDIVAFAVPREGMGEGSGFCVSEVSVAPNTLGDAYAGKVRDGGTVSFAVAPEQDFVVDGIADAHADEDHNGNVLTAVRRKDGSYVVTITNVAADVDLRVDVKRLYTVNIADSPYGHVEVQDANGATIAAGAKVKAGTKLSVRAVPNKHCGFAAWTDALQAESAAVVGHTLESNVTFGASFYRTWSVTIRPSDLGSVTVKTADGTTVVSGQRLREGTKLKVVAKANKYCVFERWNKPSKDVAPKLSITLGGNVVIEPMFCRTYKVSIATSSLGKIVVTDSSGNAVTSGQRVREGTKLKVKAVPAKSCEFSWWESTLAGKAPSTSWKVASNVSLKAKFVRLPIMVKPTAVKKKSVKLQWTLVQGASRYLVYVQSCDNKKLTTVYGVYDANTTSASLRGLVAGSNYKFKVVAQKESGASFATLSSSMDCHCVTQGNKAYTNPAAVEAKKTTEKLAVGATKTIRATLTREDASKKLLGHEAELRYKSSNTTVAAVSSAGKVTARRSGRCTIYVYAENGVFATVQVIVS